MFHSPLELEAHGRHRMAEVASETRRCALAELATAGTPSRLTQLRRRLGIGLVQLGAAIAGSDALRGVPTCPAWPELANR